MQHQISNATKYNRYPIIFKECVEYFKHKKPKILSFGCSDGREVQTLKELYFKDSYIDGVDISEQMILTCKKLELGEKINFYKASDFKKDKYDLIFCMSVLCRWPQTQNLKDCSSEYSFSQFERQILELDEMLETNGILVVYNSNFLFTDSVLNNKYKPLESKHLTESGFVKKFNKNNKEININYKYSIFIKL